MGVINGSTFTVAVALDVEQLSLPVTVYTVVTAGEANTEKPVVALKPAAGSQVYVFAPLAVSV